jgi:hypothetical protein
MAINRNRIGVFLTFAAALAVCGGCRPASSLPKTYAVKGRVVDADGRPVADARVEFLEFSPSGGAPAWQPRGVTGSDGAFTLTTYSMNDNGSASGAPAGTYTVVVTPRADGGDQTHQATPRPVTLPQLYAVAVNDANDLTLTLPAADQP